ncbi:hypothetical protein FRB91_006796 [Serendipita sp. 411]|nr:hypothetical protein FRB91_006796 [Serendipita sp. 411]
MVHHRFNTKEANPNPHINFITSLNAEGAPMEAARETLRALAAQVRPVMKKHRLEINSLEEYEHNNVFLGRNWNAGETVELVLRRADGTFYSTPQLLNVFCHELSHIRHMNHGASFWAYYRQLRKEVAALQRANYFGDGFWSSGQVLRDGAREDRVREVEDLPEYLCGGAQSQSPPKRNTGRKRTAKRQGEPSSSRRARKPKAGSRVKSRNAFQGNGKALNADENAESRRQLGTGFRKQAGSKRARDIRVAAIEARLNKLQGEGSLASSSTLHHSEEEGSTDDEDEGEEYAVVAETDADRRRILSASTKDDESENVSLRTQKKLTNFWDKGVSAGKQSLKGVGGDSVIIDLSDEEEEVPETREDVEDLLRRLGLDIKEEGDDPDDLDPSKEASRPLGGSEVVSRAEVVADIQEEENYLIQDDRGDGSGSKGGKEEWACRACTL